ncbi:MAG: FAD-dependent oxidoreductase [Candidatus Nitrosothermus koennekii]|nr:MAG: FAD-dependent oxidoreductase [Candidatus Nitrosothermus koennekii]
MQRSYDIVIIGSGILGVSLAYMLSSLTNKSIAVIEQEDRIAYHTSSRNSGKVHAPFLYNPKKKRLFAKASFLGFDMWRIYAKIKGIPFKIDGVLEVALDDYSIDRLDLYRKWGEEDGLNSDDVILLDGSEVKKLESEVRCLKALYCKRDASTNYGMLTNELARDAESNGVTFILNNKVLDINDKIRTKSYEINYKFLINAAGGESIDIAHKMHLAKEFTDIHFRGEYWKAPNIYNNLTKVSIYSVPKYPEYPFLDPHWLVKVDGSCEVGPNAVLVFSQYAYNNLDNLKMVIPKTLEMINSGARKVLLDKQFLMLVKDELLSSLSKTVMINRVKRFLPTINPKAFKVKGIAGIRSSVIDRYGRFASDPIIIMDNRSMHILNYNSPGATGALPFAIYLINKLDKEGIIKVECNKQRYWDLRLIMEELE